MITLLIGENDFEKEKTLARFVEKHGLSAEKYDGTELGIKNLPDLLMGMTLFSTKRLIVIKNLSENNEVWVKFGEMMSNISDDTMLILDEKKPDKRSATYKTLTKNAELIEHNNWGERDYNTALTWLINEAKQMGLKLDTKIAQHIVDRVGVNQWNLYHALEKLILVDEINIDVVDAIIEANPSENVFNILETALRGDGQKLKAMIEVLESTEDPYKLFSLLSSQVFQLSAVALAGKDDNVASDFGIHPYVVSKFRSGAKSKSRGDIKKIVNALSEADDDIKLSRAEPWFIIERALQKIAIK